MFGIWMILKDVLSFIIHFVAEVSGSLAQILSMSFVLISLSDDVKRTQ